MIDQGKDRRMSKKFTKAEEVYVILRELSLAKAKFSYDVRFTWAKFRDVFACVSGPGMHWGAEAWKTTIGKVLRGFLANGLVTKTGPGKYKFTWHGLVVDAKTVPRWYYGAGEFPSNFVKNAHLRLVSSEEQDG